MVFCFQVNYTTNQTPLSGHRAPPLFRGGHQVPRDRRWRERLTDRPDSLRRQKMANIVRCLRWSAFDEQRGNLVVLECEAVTELDRTSWKTQDLYNYLPLSIWSAALFLQDASL